MLVKISDIMELLEEEWAVDADGVVDAASLVREIVKATNDSFVSGFEAGKAEGYEEGYANGRASAMRIDRSGDGGACGWHWRWRW